MAGRSRSHPRDTVAREQPEMSPVVAAARAVSCPRRSPVTPSSRNGFSLGIPLV
jgi:hypothetical protein